MVKYSYKFKMKFVQAYLSREGRYKYLAGKYNVYVSSNIKKSTNAYKEFGSNCLMRSCKKESYTFNFKCSSLL